MTYKLYLMKLFKKKKNRQIKELVWVYFWTVKWSVFTVTDNMIVLIYFSVTRSC